MTNHFRVVFVGMQGEVFAVSRDRFDFVDASLISRGLFEAGRPAAFLPCNNQLEQMALWPPSTFLCGVKTLAKPAPLCDGTAMIEITEPLPEASTDTAQAPRQLSVPPALAWYLGHLVAVLGCYFRRWLGKRKGQQLAIAGKVRQEDCCGA